MTVETSTVRSPLWGTAGAAAALAVWLLLVPWDLSEVDAQGRVVEGGGDDSGPLIALVGIVILAGGMAMTLSTRTRRQAATAVTGASVTWAGLFAWRAGTAEVSGANFFMLPLVFVVLPVTLAMPSITRWLARRFDRA